MREIDTYIESEDRLITETVYDNSDVLDANLADRNASSETARYKGSFVHVGRIDMGDVVRLKNIGYNLLSPDPEEYKRALLYIQQNEPHLLTVPGKPFAKKRAVWN